MKGTGASNLRLSPRFGFVLALILLGSAACFGALRGLFQGPSDPIGRAGWETENRLAAYARNGDPKPMVEWLMTYHGEAPSHQVMMTLGEWACKHQQEFLTLFESVERKDRSLLFERFTWGLMDSGQHDDFRQAFKNYSSPVLDEMRMRSWPR